MGDNDFTDEEKVILGEKEPEPQPDPEKSGDPEGVKPEGEKTEPKPEDAPTEDEKKAAESMGLRVDKGYIIDDDGTKIPAKRWKGLYRDYQDRGRTIEEKDRKFNLFRELGPEKYYELYPGDKPANYQPPEKQREAKGAEFEDLGKMIVQGGPYDGKTLNEVYQENPAYAQQLQYQYLTAKNQEVETAKQKDERLRQDSEKEVNDFTESISKDLFGKESARLSETEQRKVAETIQGVLDWMGKTRRGGGVLADAYFLMNKETILTDAKTKGGKEALEALKRPVVSSVDTRGGASVSGFTAYEGMSGDQLAAEVERMSEAAYAKFMKDAPQSLRAKHPGLPWS